MLETPFVDAPFEARPDLSQAHDENAILRERAQNDFFLCATLRTVSQAEWDFETALVADRLALIAAHHETRYCGVELRSLRKARDRDIAELDPRPADWRIWNLATNESHATALESRRKTAAATLILTVDRLFDAYWTKLGLPDWSVRGGPAIAGDVTMVELIHLCGNYLRHAHEWFSVATPSKRAQTNIGKLRQAGFDFRDDDLLPHVLETFPNNFTDLEIALLDFVQFMTWFTREAALRAWAQARGATYHVTFNSHDTKTSGYAKLATDLEQELGSQWKLPGNPGAPPPEF
jgi:hypothetical protein